MKRLLSALGLSIAVLSSQAQTTPVVVASTVECATSIDGSVVGIRNPLDPPIVAAAYTGTLPAGNYYTQIAWYDAAGHITLAGPEVQTQLTGTGELQINLPASGIPAAAVGMKVYIGSSSGAETLQGSTTGAATFTQSAPLSTGAALPATNATLCQVVANDAGWPSGTGYSVVQTTPSGDTVPGYPMQWQLLGPGTTINLGQGLPLYNGNVLYPIPIQARPYNHATQSISGPLSMTGYAITQVSKLGVGTSVPGWSIDVEGGVVNSSGGYLYNGGQGVTPGNCMVAGSDTYRTFAPGPCLPGVIYYQTAQTAGVSLAQQPRLNFLGSLVATDNPGNSSTDVGLAEVGSPGTYASPTSITFDANGRETAVSAGTAVNRTCNANGCYQVSPDGTISAWGIVTAPTSGATLVTVPISFPIAFTTEVSLVVSGGSAPNGTGNDSMSVYHTGLTLSGATAVLRCGVNILGSGCANFNNAVPVNWQAKGH